MLETVDPNIPGQPVLRRIALDRGTHHDVQQSPISSASERFQSPVAASGVAKKRLFSDTRIGGQSVLRGTGQSVLPSKVLTIDSNSRILFLPEQITVPRSSSVQTTAAPIQTVTINRESAKPKRTGSVALFFRKFYNLASVRMLDLCGSLEIMDIDLKKKIWTIFEYSIKERTELMKDRHLDQILMCAIYVICKLVKMEKNSFTEIMRCYRLQPQAESHIYRSVLGSVMNLSLSPLPKGKPPANSPVRRVTSSIMTRTLDPKAISASPAPQLSYCFSRSPAKVKK